jgi:hypothetical protein
MSPKWMDAIKTFTDNVKKGVLTNDMKLVQDSLEEFMGERLAGMSVKEIEEPTDDEGVEEMVEKNDDDFTMPVPDDAENSKQRLTKGQPLNLKDRENQFADDGTIEVDDAGANLIDDSATKPVKRSRKPSEGLTNITCHLCGKVELISPSFKREHYRCSACCKG